MDFLILILVLDEWGLDDISFQLARAVEYTAFLQWTKTPQQRVSCYDLKQSDSEAPAMLELWGMWSNLSLPLLPGSLCIEVLAPDRVLSMGQIKLFVI